MQWWDHEMDGLMQWRIQECIVIDILKLLCALGYTLTYEQRLCLLIHYYHYRYHYQHNHQRQHGCIHIYLSTVIHHHDNNNSSSNKKIKLPHYSTYSQHISITWSTLFLPHVAVAVMMRMLHYYYYLSVPKNPIAPLLCIDWVALLLMGCWIIALGWSMIDSAAATDQTHC